MFTIIDYLLVTSRRQHEQSIDLERRAQRIEKETRKSISISYGLTRKMVSNLDVLVG